MRLSRWLPLLSAFAGLKQRFSNSRGGFGLPFFSLVLVMKNASNPYNAMAGFYRTAFAFSALIISASVAYAADPPVPRGNVSVNLNPTTSYYSVSNNTLRLPHGVSVAPTSGGLPVVSKYAGGLQQTIPSSVTIDAIKKSAPMSAVVRATTQSAKRAATGCLTSGKCNAALLLAGLGLNALFEGLDWVMGEGGQIQKISSTGDYIAPSDYPNSYYTVTGVGKFSTPSSACSEAGSPFSAGKYCYASKNHQDNNWPNGTVSFIKSSSFSCPAGASSDSFGCISPPAFSPVTPSAIESAVESNYTPEPSDWQGLAPELGLDSVEITSAPTLQGEPKTTTHYDADGNPHKITETNISYEFDIRDNSSANPALDLKTSEQTKTYEDGVLTGTTTTNSTSSGGSANTSTPAPELDIPTDCDFMPTVCAFLEWFKGEPTEPEDNLPDLLREVPIVSETFTITGGAAACPAPLVLDLSVFGSREVSYQPLCDLASTMKYLYLALMSFAAAVLLNRSINRV